jgi:hypothetical protein
MKRTPLVRRAALRATSILRSTAPRPVPPGTRARLAVRSGGLCELWLPEVCTGRPGIARDVHHRVTVKMGGRHGEARVGHDRLSNLLHVCRRCHGYVTADPAQSYLAGWSLREFQVPSVEPVTYRGAAVYLDDEGGREMLGVPRHACVRRSL